MTQPAEGTPHIPGLITAAGTTTPALPATAQPGGQLPPGTVTPGALPPAPQIVVPAPAAPALPQAGQPTQTVQPVQVDPAVIAAYLAAQQTQPPTAQPVAPVAPAPVVTPAPQQVLPTAVIPQPPAPVSVPGLNTPISVPPAQQPVPPVAQPPAAPAPAPATEPDGLTDGDGKDYPEGKPLAEMTDPERAAYYRWYSRQHENRSRANKAEADRLRAELEQVRATPQAPVANQQDLDARIAAAIQQGYQQAAAAAAVTLVDAHVRAGLQARLQPHQVEALAANLNHTHFLGADGRSVDADKVAAFVNTVAPASTPATPAVPAATASTAPAAPGALPTSLPVPGQPATGLPRPDLGQGSQQQSSLDKYELGRQQARAFLAGNL